MTKRDEATERQVRAAMPGLSTWLSANAGSGKTRVLTDRVARLLLEGVEPQHILCLTYTKAAASEMQNRLFGRLGRWAMLEDQNLRGELDKLGVEGKIENNALRRARTLFARAIEAPGGLKIQTIHSFCAALLRQFPLEAGVSPNFEEMEDRSGKLLREHVVDSMATSHGDLVARLAFYINDEDFDGLTSQIIRRKAYFNHSFSDDSLWELFGLPKGFCNDQLRASVFLGSEAGLLETLVAALKNGSSTDIKAAGKLANISYLDPSSLPLLESVFLTGAGAKSPFSAKLGSFPTKATQSRLEDNIDEINQWMLRVEKAREFRLALAAAKKTRALYLFANVFLPKYEAAQQLRGWLDFDDLIGKTLQLLNDEAVAAWVLYRLDGGIDHILVDEAQDTSPAQWGVIEKLAQEFTSGSGARSDISRTIFVVGDKKQSIYSFQGADPREFDRMQAEFSNRLQHTNTPLQNMVLQHSFRSASSILEVVDRTFEGHEKSGFSKDQTHRAFKVDLPGRVDLWPVIDEVKPVESGNWFDPVDRPGENRHSLVLARRIASQIKDMICDCETIPENNSNNELVSRPVRAGDFLILVQTRGPLFHEIIRECKAQNLPIAGSDRLKVGAEMAVKDLMALLSFLATPEDNLSLAVALKSPLFRWDEQALFDLSHKRKQEFLWAALRARRNDFPSTIEVLEDLRNQIDFLRPYDLLERILTRHDGRRNLLARLGHEAEDGINALLAQALAFEKNAIPSLTGFIQWMEADDLELKRQMDSSGNEIRVMTVHGAKGLESPIVILPDTARRTISVKDDLLIHGDNILWKTNNDETPDTIQKAKDHFIEIETLERDRLLYVAMTRAEKWLIVAASGSLGNDGASWYNRIRVAMDAADAKEHPFSFGNGLRFSAGNWSGLAHTPPPPEVCISTDLPAYFQTNAPDIKRGVPTLSPSMLGGAKALAGEAGLDENQALRRGRQIHLLLEKLPEIDQDKWGEHAQRLLETGKDFSTPEEVSDLLDEVRRVLTSPALRHLFDEKALVEVPLSATIKELENRRIHGTVDRLLITKEKVVVVDFKTNALIPDQPKNCPDGLLRQMGAYGAALALIYPDRPIETALLWTKTASLMVLPKELVYQALCDTQIP